MSNDIVQADATGLSADPSTPVNSKLGIRFRLFERLSDRSRASSDLNTKERAMLTAREQESFASNDPTGPIDMAVDALKEAAAEMRTRRAALASLAGLGAALSLPKGAPPAADPTFALIERHRAAYTAFIDALGGDVDDAPIEEAAEQAAMDALLTPEPTTLAGLRALAEHMHEHDKRTDEFHTAQAALATIAEACRRLIPTTIGGVA